MQYLLGQNPFPPETFANLLLLYCKYEYYDLTADVLAENASLTYKYLEQYMYDYFDALITLQTSDVDAYNKLEKLAENQANIMRKKYQHLMQLRQSPNSKTLHKALDEFERELGRYLPLLMMQAKIFWDKGNYARVEQLFRRSAEFCSENHTWKMNLAHTLFMQEKFRVSVNKVRKKWDDFLLETIISELKILSVFLQFDFCESYIELESWNIRIY